MPCCGKTLRPAEVGDAPARPGPSGVRPPAAMSPARQEVVRASARFEHTTASGLTVVGPVTGRRYYFAGRGAAVDVDERDAPSLAAVPGLRRARVSTGS